MFEYYTGTIVLTVLLTIIMMVRAAGSTVFSREQKMGIIATFLLILITAVCEWISVYYNGRTGAGIWVHRFVKALELSLAPFITVTFAPSIGVFGRIRGVIVLMVVHAGLEFSSMLTGMIFWVDQDNLYYHGKFYGIYYLVVGIGILLLFRESFALNKRNQNTNAHILGMILVLLVCGQIPHILFSYLRLDWLNVAICTTLFYGYYNETLEQMDPLTGILGRGSYEAALRYNLIRKAIIMMDVNDFKAINDRDGHLAGDMILKRIAALMRDTFGKCGRCYRIGGDEFCVIMTKNLGEIDEYIERFQAKINGERVKNASFPGISVGYGMCLARSEDITGALKRADKMMYESKNKSTCKDTAGL